VIVDCAHYKDGKRQASGKMDLDEAAACIAGPDDEGFVWIGLHEPTGEEIEAVRQRFDLHPLAVEDAESAHQRPKLEDYENGAYFIVLRTARYDDAREVVEFGEVHLFIGPGYVVSVRHGEASDLRGARQRLEDNPELAKLGPGAVVWAILDKIVDDYEPVTLGLENDIEEVEAAVFGDEGDQSRRIYFLRREVTAFARAVHPLLITLSTLDRGGGPDLPALLREYLRDVADHVKQVDEEVITQRELLSTVLQANLAAVSVAQNEQVRKISGWAAIIAVPTFIASIYGMNFDHMPELHWRIGYPLSIAVMGLVAAGLFRYFRRVGWL
jgi:magnesium transporter